MNEKYKEFLESYDIISEKDFEKALELLPKGIIPKFSEITYADIVEVPEDLIHDILTWAINKVSTESQIDDIDINRKTLYLHDVYTIDDLNKIKDLIEPEWHIKNYKTLLENIKAEENSNKTYLETFIKERISKKLVQNLDLETLKEIYNKYVNEE